MKPKIKSKLLFALLVITLLTVFIPISKSQNTPPNVNVDLQIQIFEVNPENHTILANISMAIHNYKENADYLVIKFLNYDQYDVKCSKNAEPDGAIYYTGKLEPKYWYLITNGELYPFDFNVVNLKLSPEYIIEESNGTTFTSNYQNTLSIRKATVNFNGFQWTDYLNNWAVVPVNRDNQILLYFQRLTLNSQYTIVIPLIWFLTIVAAMPILTLSKNIKITFYTSVLFFAPVFIFTVQGFIPQRSSLSIPEYLSFVLILASTIMIILTFPTYQSEKKRRNAEITGLLASLIVSYILGVMLFSRFLVMQESTTIVASQLFLITIIFGITALFRELTYQRYVKKQESVNLEYNPEDFAH